MIVNIEENEVKTAVVEWIKRQYPKSIIQPEDLTAVYVDERDYETTTKTMVGFSFKLFNGFPKGFDQ